MFTVCDKCVRVSPTPNIGGQLRRLLGNRTIKKNVTVVIILFSYTQATNLQQSDDHSITANEAEARRNLSQGPGKPLTVVGKRQAWTVWMAL